MSCHYRTAICPLMILVLLAGPAVSLAQDPPIESDTELDKLDARVKRFLDGVSADDVQSAYEDLLAGSQLLQQKSLKELIEKTGELKKFGKCHGFEQIGAKPVGKDLVLLRYLHKCEDFPVVWYFGFYRTPDNDATAAGNGAWRVVSVRFDTQLELLWLSP